MGLTDKRKGGESANGTWFIRSDRRGCVTYKQGTDGLKKGKAQGNIAEGGGWLSRGGGGEKGQRADKKGYRSAASGP